MIVHHESNFASRKHFCRARFFLKRNQQNLFTADLFNLKRRWIIHGCEMRIAWFDGLIWIVHRFSTGAVRWTSCAYQFVEGNGKQVMMSAVHWKNRDGRRRIKLQPEISEIIPGDWGKAGSGWLTRFLWNQIEKSGGGSIHQFLWHVRACQ